MADSWTCPTCAGPRQGRYCAECGERALHPHDLTLFGLAEQGIEAIAHVDGRVFLTFKALMQQPGALTASFLCGQRKRFLGPLQVFLIANVVFFAFQSVFHARVFSSPLESQLHSQYYKGLASRLTAARLEALNTNQEQYAPAFDHAVAVNAKSLIVLMTPPLALFASLLFYNRHRPFVAHVVFAIHFYAFWLVLFCVLAPVLAIAIQLFMLASGTRLSPRVMDIIVSYALIACAAGYLFQAAGRVYAERGLQRLWKIALLAVTAAATAIGYRFVVFVITLYTTGG